MTPEKRRFVDPNQLGENLSVQQVLSHLGVPDASIQSRRNEVRTECFLQCGKTHPTGPRALAIRDGDPAMLWKCHDYNCQRGGNLISLVSLATGGPEKPKGQDFWKIVELIEGIRVGIAPTTTQQPSTPAQRNTAPPPPAEPRVNVPLAEHESERVRAVATLYEKLTLDVSRMSPAASQYVRRCGFLTEEIAAKWGIGYLARDTNGDRSGGTMRGKFVATLRNRQGEVVGYCGRDCDWETKHELWVAGGRQGKEPAKWIFPRNFLRGVELYAADRVLQDIEGTREKLQGIGLPVVEGVLDAIKLTETLDVPAVAILSNQAANEQVEQIAELAYAVADGNAVLLYDCDEQGEKGMDGDIVKLSKLCRVQRG